MQKPEGFSMISSFYIRLRISLYLFVGVLFIGTIGYKILAGDKYSLLNCFYMTIITLSTVGYGEIVDLSGSPAGRIFTVFLIIIGMGILLYVVSNVTAFIVEGEMLKIFWRRRMDKLVSKMKGHYIICGGGRIGSHVIQEFIQTKRQVVAIDIDEAKADELLGRFPDIPVLNGDGIENDLLCNAGIERAAGIVVATGSDKDNMVITMTARQMNPDLRIVARCNDMNNFDKLKSAGADSVVSSNLIGGLRIAAEMVRPIVVSFLDEMLRDREKNLRVEEVAIPEGSRLGGMTVAEAGVSRVANALLLALRQQDGQWVYNPGDDFVISAGMELIIMGSPADKRRVEELVAG